MADHELWFRQLHPEDRDRALAEEERRKETGEPLRSEYRLLTRAGRILWFRDEAVVAADNAGRTTRVRTQCWRRSVAHRYPSAPFSNSSSTRRNCFTSSGFVR